MKRKNLAVVIGILGLVGMFFFPSPEENFLYYMGFVVAVVVLIVFVLKWNVRGNRGEK